MRRGRAFLRAIPISIVALANLTSVLLSAGGQRTRLDTTTFATLVLWLDVIVILILGIRLVVLPLLRYAWHHIKIRYIIPHVKDLSLNDKDSGRAA